MLRRPQNIVDGSVATKLRNHLDGSVATAYYFCLSFITEKVKATLSRPQLCIILQALVSNLPEVSHTIVTTVMYILTMLKKVFPFQVTHQFLSRVSILTCDSDIANLSVCLSVRPSVCNVPVSDENGLTYRNTFFTTWQPNHSSFISIKPPHEIPTGSPPAGAQNIGGV